MAERGFIVDHIIPLAYGGTNLFENLQFLCNSCDKKKTSEDIKLKRLGAAARTANKVLQRDQNRAEQISLF